jgi:hypothetical protein
MKKNFVILLSAVLMIGSSQVSAKAATPEMTLQGVISSLNYTGQAVNYYKSIGDNEAAKSAQRSFDLLLVQAKLLSDKSAKVSGAKLGTTLDRATLNSSLRYTGQALAYYKSIGDTKAAKSAQDSINAILVQLKSVK